MPFRILAAALRYLGLVRYLGRPAATLTGKLSADGLRFQDLALGRQPAILTGRLLAAGQKKQTT